MLSVFMLNVIHYAECHYAECHYADCRGTRECGNQNIAFKNKKMSVFQFFRKKKKNLQVPTKRLGRMTSLKTN